MSDKKELLKLIIPILLGVILIGFLSFSSFQKFRGLADLESLIDEKNAELEVAEERLSSLLKLQENRHLFAQKQEDFSKIIPPTPQDREVYEHVKRVADAYNVYIEGMEFQESIDRGFYNEIPVALQISGSYSGVVHTLDGIQNGERMINIVNTEIAQGEFGNIQGKVILETFFRPIPEIVVEGD